MNEQKNMSQGKNNVKKMILLGVIGALVLLVFLIIGSIIIIRGRVNVSTTFVQYNSVDYSFMYDSILKIKDISGDGATVALSKAEIEDTNFINTIRIERSTQIGVLPVAAMANLELDRLEASKLTEYNLEFLDDLKVTDLEAMQFRYSYKKDDKTIIGEYTYIIKDLNVYLFKMVVEEDLVTEHDVYYDKLLTSFKFN